VNRALVRLLESKRRELNERGIDWRITGVASRRLGWIASENGVDTDNILRGETRAGTPQVLDIRQWLNVAKADVVFEATSLNPHSGRPAIEHIRAGLEHGAHAITANKGPVVYAFDELHALASAHGKRFLFESTVMDGIPIFSLFRDSLPVLQLKGFHGILNSTTNVILSGMEEGLNFEESLKRAQKLGVAETDASHDIEGWDAAVKVAALVRVLMGISLPPAAIQREGIAGLSSDIVLTARSEGSPFKLVCRAWRTNEGVRASVRPEQVPLGDPMAVVAGTSSIICFETDVFPGIAIIEIDPGVDATAYGMLADFVRAVED
jgi:homoserine dehydrogenase